MLVKSLMPRAASVLIGPAEMALKRPQRLKPLSVLDFFGAAEAAFCTGFFRHG
jgi:hypothetical protein